MYDPAFVRACMHLCPFFFPMFIFFTFARDMRRIQNRVLLSLSLFLLNTLRIAHNDPFSHFCRIAFTHSTFPFTSSASHRSPCWRSAYYKFNRHKERLDIYSKATKIYTGLSYINFIFHKLLYIYKQYSQMSQVYNCVKE